MTGNSHRESAKIYQFPVGGRSGPATRRETLRSAAEFLPEVTARVAIGGNWYHEEAIRDAETSRKH